MLCDRDEAKADFKKEDYRRTKHINKGSTIKDSTHSQGHVARSGERLDAKPLEMLRIHKKPRVSLKASPLFFFLLYFSSLLNVLIIPNRAGRGDEPTEERTNSHYSPGQVGLVGCGRLVQVLSQDLRVPAGRESEGERVPPQI